MKQKLLHVSLMKHQVIFFLALFHICAPFTPGIQAGAIFVNDKAEVHFKRMFQEAGYDEEDTSEYTKQAVNSFESNKKAFEYPQGEVTIEVGGHRLTDLDLSIRRGLMK